MADEPPTAAPSVPDGHPMDMVAEAAGRDMWETIQQWRGRHPHLTRVQYLWIFNQVLSHELRQMGRDEQAEYDRRTGYAPPPGAGAPTNG